MYLGDLHNYTLLVDDEQTAESKAGLFNKYVIIDGDLLGQVRNQGEVNLATKATLLAGSVNPGQMRILRIHRYTNNLTK